MIQNIFIIGATGNVGKTLVRQIFEKGDTDSGKHENPTKIVGLASSKGYVFNTNGLEKDRCVDFSEKKISGENYSSLGELKKVVGDEQIIFVDVTPLGKEMLDFHKDIIEKTNHKIVTANKNPLVLSNYKTFRGLISETKRYGYRCSVMAGAEAVEKVKDLKDLGDEIFSIEGCFSGTLGHICSELEKGRKISEIILECKGLGYTEPDPFIDLSGEDVAKKILILARTAGFGVDYNDIKLEPFVSREVYESDNLDEYFKKIIESLDKDKALRYIASLKSVDGKFTISVKLTEVDGDSLFGSIQGTLNKVVVVSKTYSEDRPYVISGPGAGLEVTSQNIRRDLLHQIEDRKLS